MDRFPPEQYWWIDQDATVSLSVEEYDNLLGEFLRLINPAR